MSFNLVMPTGAAYVCINLAAQFMKVIEEAGIGETRIRPVLAACFNDWRMRGVTVMERIQ